MTGAAFLLGQMNDRLNHPGDIRNFVEAARRAAADDNWFAAMSLALTLPDICAAVDDPGKGKSAERYAVWWDNYMAWRYWVEPDDDEVPQWEPFSYLAGGDAYALRCAYLHSGTDVVAGSKATHQRIRFLGPPSSNGFGFDRQEQILYVGLEQFVEWVCLGVEKWLWDRRGDVEAQDRLTGLVTIIPSAIRFPKRPRQP